MGSLRLEGVWFFVYADDHRPEHIHARYGGVSLIVELAPDAVPRVQVRPGSTQPRNAKRADVRHILRMADNHFGALVSLWEALHG